MANKKSIPQLRKRRGIGRESQRETSNYTTDLMPIWAMLGTFIVMLFFAMGVAF